MFKQLRDLINEAASEFEQWHLLLFGFFAALAFVFWYFDKTNVPFPLHVRRP